MKRYWIWMSMNKGLSSKDCLRVLAAFGDPKRVYEASKSELEQTKGITKKDVLALLEKDLSAAERILSVCKQCGIGVLTLEDDRYPELLRQIPDPPVVLYYTGRLPDFDRELPLAVVGQRKATEHGLSAAACMGMALGLGGAIVISGCADGIDRAAMEGALHSGATVVGVLGCGVDVVYPAGSRHLYETIPQHGCLISEYAPGTQPDRWNFPARNRIISGLSRGVVVVEAPRKSGSLITARHALEQGRDVFALPGAAGDPACAGSNDLLRQGASFAENGSDVLRDYLYLFPERVHIPSDQELESCADTYFNASKNISFEEQVPQKADPLDKKDIDKRNSPKYIDLNATAAGLPPEEAAVLLSLKTEPLPVDLIVMATEMDVWYVQSALTMLEIRGLVCRHPGGFWSLKQNS